jgi:hypothetical protein
MTTHFMEASNKNKDKMKNKIKESKIIRKFALQFKLTAKKKKIIIKQEKRNHNVIA